MYAIPSAQKPSAVYRRLPRGKVQLDVQVLCAESDNRRGTRLYGLDPHLHATMHSIGLCCIFAQREKVWVGA